MKLEGTIKHGVELRAENAAQVGCEMVLCGGMTLRLTSVGCYDVSIAFGPIGSYVDLTKYYTKTETNTLLGGKADKSDTYTKGEVNKMFSHINIDMDDTPTDGSNNAVSSGGVYSALADKVDKVNGKGLSSNDYTDTDKEKLAGIESGAKANVQSDWNESNASSDAFIKNKPTLANVATSGSYEDLTNKPSIPAAQVQSDWNESNSSNPGYIKNKPTIPAQIQSDWSQSDTSAADFIKNKPSIPSKTSDLTNDSGFLTEHQSLANYYTKTEVNSAIDTYCPVIDDTRSSASATITGVVPFAILSDKQSVVIRLAYKTVANTSLNLTLSDGNTTGAIPVYAQYSASETRVADNYFKSGCLLALVYNSSRNVLQSISQFDTNTVYSQTTDAEINTGTNTSSRTISAKVLRDNFYTESEVNTLLSGKQNTLTFDNVPTANSDNPVKSGGVYSVLGDIETLLAAI